MKPLNGISSHVGTTRRANDVSIECVTLPITTNPAFLFEGDRLTFAHPSMTCKAAG